MLTDARKVWSDLRAGFWFLPSVLLVAHVGIAIILTSTGLAVNKPWMDRWPNLFGAGADGARGMLSTIAGSMMTVVGVTLSMTLVTLALASNQYTSRILRNFIRDRITQFVLGLFAGIYCYSLIVLRTIRGGDEGGFVPGLAVLLGVLLAVAGIVVLIYFIHHIATSIQASNIIASVAGETLSAIDRLYPENVATLEENSIDVPHHDGPWRPLTAARNGYIERIDSHALHQLASTNRARVRIERGIGDFVVRGTPLLSVPRGTFNTGELESALMVTIDVGRNRTLEQDVGFGIRQLVDIALRALSPGVNDTTTAVMCIDYLTAILASLAGRPIVNSHVPSDGSGWLIDTRGPSFAGFLYGAFDQIREHGRRDFAVLERLLQAIRVIGGMPIGAERRQILLEQLGLLEEAMISLESARDRERLSVMAEPIRVELMPH
jgi:uncharacterized membrane protein